MSADSDYVLVETAKAVAAALTNGANAGAFPGLSFVTGRKYPEAVEDEEIKASQGLLVDIVGNNPDEGSPLSRSRRKYIVTLDGYVRQKFGHSDFDTAGLVKIELLDRLTGFVQELREFFAPGEGVTPTDCQRLAYQPGSSLVGTLDDERTKIRFSWSRKHLRENKQFFGAVSFVFEVIKAI